jgi:hypothetical protein
MKSEVTVHGKKQLTQTTETRDGRTNKQETNKEQYQLKQTKK